MEFIVLTELKTGSCTEMAKDTCYFKLQYIAKLAVYFS